MQGKLLRVPTQGSGLTHRVTVAGVEIGQTEKVERLKTTEPFNNGRSASGRLEITTQLNLYVVIITKLKLWGLRID